MLLYECYLIRKKTYLSKQRHFIFVLKNTPLDLLGVLSDQFHSINVSFLILFFCGGNHQHFSNKSSILWWQMNSNDRRHWSWSSYEGFFMWEITLMQWQLPHMLPTKLSLFFFLACMYPCNFVLISCFPLKIVNSMRAKILFYLLCKHKTYKCAWHTLPKY